MLNVKGSVLLQQEMAGTNKVPSVSGWLSVGQAAMAERGDVREPQGGPQQGGWGRLHTCGTSSNQFEQVKAAITTRTHSERERSPAWQHGAPGHVPLSATLTMNGLPTPPPWVLGLEKPFKSHPGGAWHSPRSRAAFGIVTLHFVSLFYTVSLFPRGYKY